MRIQAVSGLSLSCFLLSIARRYLNRFKMDPTFLFLMFACMMPVQGGKDSNKKVEVASWKESKVLCRRRGRIATLQRLELYMIKNEIPSAWVNVTERTGMHERYSATVRGTYLRGTKSAAKCSILLASLEIGSHKYKLQRVPCKEKHYFVCQSDVEAFLLNGSNQSQPQSQTSPLRQGHTTMSGYLIDSKEYTHTQKLGSPSLLQIVVPGVAVVALMIVGVSVCVMHRHDIFYTLQRRANIKQLKGFHCCNRSQTAGNKSDCPSGLEVSKGVDTADAMEKQYLMPQGTNAV